MQDNFPLMRDNDALEVIVPDEMTHDELFARLELVAFRLRELGGAEKKIEMVELITTIASRYGLTL